MASFAPGTSREDIDRELERLRLLDEERMRQYQRDLRGVGRFPDEGVAVGPHIYYPPDENGLGRMVADGNPNYPQIAQPRSTPVASNPMSGFMSGSQLSPEQLGQISPWLRSQLMANAGAGYDPFMNRFSSNVAGGSYSQLGGGAGVGPYAGATPPPGMSAADLTGQYPGYNQSLAANQISPEAALAWKPPAITGGFNPNIIQQWGWTPPATGPAIGGTWTNPRENGAQGSWTDSGLFVNRTANQFYDPRTGQVQIMPGGTAPSPGRAPATSASSTAASQSSASPNAFTPPAATTAPPLMRTPPSGIGPTGRGPVGAPPMNMRPQLPPDFTYNMAAYTNAAPGAAGPPAQSAPVAQANWTSNFPSLSQGPPMPPTGASPTQMPQFGGPTFQPGYIPRGPGDLPPLLKEYGDWLRQLGRTPTPLPDAGRAIIDTPRLPSLPDAGRAIIDTPRLPSNAPTWESNFPFLQQPKRRPDWPY